MLAAALTLPSLQERNEEGHLPDDVFHKVTHSLCVALSGTRFAKGIDVTEMNEGGGPESLVRMGVTPDR